MPKKAFPVRTLAMLFLCLPLFLSCSVRTPDTVHTESETDREHRIEIYLQDYERRIQELDAKTLAATGALREELQRSLDDVQQKHQAALKKLQELRTSTNRAWTDVNAQLQISLDEMKSSFDRLREQLK